MISWLAPMHFLSVKQDLPNPSNAAAAFFKKKKE